MSFGQDGNELPFQLALGMVLEKSNAVGDLVTTDNIKPTAAQYALVPGDWALSAGSASMLDQNLILLEVVDPAEHEAEFPDWEDRLMQSYVLCNWWDKDVGEEEVQEGLGWFSRVKLIQITEEQQGIVQEWHRTDFPEDIPDWLVELYWQYTAELARVSPGKVPHFVSCGLCGGKKVLLQFAHTVHIQCPAGEIEQDGKVVYTPIGGTDDECETAARLHCLDCHGSADLDRDELKLDKRQMLGVDLGHMH